MAVPADAPCLPQDGDTVTFKRDGALMAATETWKPQGAPADVANGVSGALAGATPTPTPTPTPVPGQTETVIDDTLDLTADVTTVDGEQVVLTGSADGSISATIPVAAVTDTATVAVKIDTIAEQDLAEAIPSGTFLINGEAINITINDDQGQPITQFQQDLTFAVLVDPQTVDLDSISVTRFDTTLTPPQWVQVPATVSPNGTVLFATDHLTLFSILRLPTVTFQLAGGLNSITFTGPSGTAAADVASEIGVSLATMFVFDAPTQDWLTFLPAAPPQVNTLQTLNQRDALILRVDPGPTTWTETDIIPDPSGARTVSLIPGLNPIGFTGASGSDIAQLLAPVASAVESASRFDAQTQLWQTYLPAAPPQVNTLSVVNRLDMVYVRVAGAAALPLQLPDTGP